MANTKTLGATLIAYAMAIESGETVTQQSTIAENYRAAGERIGKLEHSIRELRDCLEAMAHPNHGWPAVEIANRFEASRRLVPDDLDNLECLSADLVQEMSARDWQERERIPDRPLDQRTADEQTPRERAEFIAHEIQNDVLAPEAEVAAAIEAEIRRFMFAPKREAKR